jgi:protein-disulfide isomerase
VSKRKRAKGGRPAQGAARNRGKAAAGQRQASPSILLAAAVITALLAVGFVLAVKLTTGSSDVKPPPAGVALPGAQDVRHLLKGIPQSGNVLGSPSAPVTLIEYVDLQCPFCQEFETQAMPTVIDRYVRSGELKVEARVLGFIGPDSQRGRDAAIAAAKQNAMFNFMQLLYDNQAGENSGWLSDAMVRSAAASIPEIDVAQLLSDSGSSATVAQARTYDSQATADKISGTPTLFVGPSGSKPKLVALNSPTDLASLRDAIDAALG